MDLEFFEKLKKYINKQTENKKIDSVVTKNILLGLEKGLSLIRDEIERNKPKNEIPNFGKNIAWLKIQTSGLIKSKHGILEIQIKVLNANGDEIDSFHSFVNPIDENGKMFEIDEKAISYNNINLNNCFDAPTFKDIANEIKPLLENNDIGGFNIDSFDIPFLLENFIRFKVKINLSNSKIIDIFKIVSKIESKKLSDLSNRFLNETFTNDVSHLYKLSRKILNQYDLTHYDNVQLHTFGIGDATYFDSDKVLKKVMEDGTAVDAILLFGKYYNKTLSEIVKTDYQYIKFLLDKSNLSIDTKNILTKLANHFKK